MSMSAGDYGFPCSTGLAPIVDNEEEPNGSCVRDLRGAMNEPGAVGVAAAADQGHRAAFQVSDRAIQTSQ